MTYDQASERLRVLVCTAYYKHHGDWPKTLFVDDVIAALAGEPTGGGASTNHVEVPPLSRMETLEHLRRVMGGVSTTGTPTPRDIRQIADAVEVILEVLLRP